MDDNTRANLTADEVVSMIARQATRANIETALDLLKAADLILGQTKVDGTPFYDLPITSPLSLRDALEDLGDDLARFDDGSLAD